MIKLQPLGSVREDLLEFLKHNLSEKFKTTVVVLKPIDIPKDCYNPMRKQYNSTCILRKLEASKITLAITEEDLYADRLNFVFGEAELGGTRAIVSCYRLRFNASDELLKQRLLKEAVHELGHVFGLRHCSNRKCVMCFSNSIFDVDMKTEEFCEKCWNTLRARL